MKLTDIDPLSVAIVLVVGLITVYVTGVAFHAQGDEICAHSLTEEATYVEDQPVFDQQLDCEYPNGTVVRDVEAKPMNLSSGPA